MTEVDVRIERLERAKNLFEFLGRAQQLKSRPQYSVSEYRTVQWFSDLPEHPSIDSAFRVLPEDLEAPILVIDRVPKAPPPVPRALLDPWLDGEVNDHTKPPELRKEIPTESVVWPDGEAIAERSGAFTHLNEHPHIAREFMGWRAHWDAWAAQEAIDQPVRDLYGELFATYVTATTHLEEFELVLGSGLLVWSPPDHAEVRRHLLTCPVSLKLDDSTGRLSVERAGQLDSLTLELDMLDPRLIQNVEHIKEVRSRVEDYEGHPLDPKAIADIIRRVVHNLDADGQYLDEDGPGTTSPSAKAALAPALILRKRTQRGLVEIFQSIVEQLAEAEDVPDGILPLVDPDYRPVAEPDPTPGALLQIDEEYFLPLPVNERQLKVLRSVDSRQQTVVKGPPGTGKTHTASALLSHLLAQGKRVLVAAHTDRALYEVRDKLPMEIKPLSVSVVGSSRSDMTDLKVAVERIASAAADFDEEEARRRIDAAEVRIDELRRQRAEAYRSLLDARQEEVIDREHKGYRGTMAVIAQQFQEEAPQFGWIAEYVEIGAETAAPLTDHEAGDWLALLNDGGLQADEREAWSRLLEIDAIPDPDVFATYCATERGAEASVQKHEDLRSHEAMSSVQELEPETRIKIQLQMQGLAEKAEVLESRAESWMSEAVFDVRAGRGGPWRARFDQITGLVDQARPLIDRLGPLTQVDILGGDPATLRVLAAHLRDFLTSGGTVKTTTAGTPKVGLLAPRAVKEAEPLFEHVRVDGLPPVREEQLSLFITFLDAERIIEALDRSWPSATEIPPEDTLAERLEWHVNEREQLRRVLDLGAELIDAEAELTALRVKPPQWADLASVLRFARLAEAAAARDAWVEAAQPLETLAEVVRGVAQRQDVAPCVSRLEDAVEARDVGGYLTAYQRLEHLHQVRAKAVRRDTWGEALEGVAPDLFTSVVQSSHDPTWIDRFARLEAAWRWAATGAWILAQNPLDVNALQAQITMVDAKIRREVETLAATRAWSHAVSPDRLTGEARADLAHYASLVRRLGKGTGKYATQQRAAIRRAMDNCRTAVPVWIMPIYRIAEQLRVHENMFDVVLVDEASQAGAEATFLQYLAPKIVVVGDDKQVSPTAVGVDQGQLRDLANQYLANDRYRDSWLDPQRSLFDEALMRYGGQITLVEHRRCVPEIIGFSNRIAYEPDGERLIPVRQYGADRLEPIQAVHVKDGYVLGTSQKINPAEVDAVVEQIEKCAADPRYDGLTFGVISLLGPAQARAIEAKLIDALDPEEWAARDLRCGDAADFQGSERDVMFLSMVAAPELGRRLAALTRDLFVQRYNVAASRAKDQMWVFHTVTLDDLGHPDDMRFALLDYCYGVLGRRDGGDERVRDDVAPNDRLVEPFDSLFEQRVFNRLYDRGYTVIPQYPAEGYSIDLVVVGAKGRLAIECDGDAWHGPEAYERDLARQRDLERCGWQFFRVRESAFYVDEPAALAGLWDALEELEIRPSGWAEEVHADQSEDASGELEETQPWTDGDDQPVAEQPHVPRVASEVVPRMGSGDASHGPESAAPSVAELTHHEDVELSVAIPGPSIVWNASTETETETANISALSHYEEFRGVTTPLEEATRREVIDGLCSVVAAEGPVLGHRLHIAYVKASGRTRVGKSMAAALNQAISQAVRTGELIADNPLKAPGVKPLTYRLPDQDEIRPRELGPRSLDDVPPAELAVQMSGAADVVGWDSEEMLFRQVLTQLGLRRLTTNAETKLRSVVDLALEYGVG